MDSLKNFNPIEIYYDRGSGALKRELVRFDIEQLKAIAKGFTVLKRSEYIKYTDKIELVEKIAASIKSKANAGAAFGDYKLPD